MTEHLTKTRITLHPQYDSQPTRESTTKFSKNKNIIKKFLKFTLCLFLSLVARSIDMKSSTSLSHQGCLPNYPSIMNPDMYTSTIFTFLSPITSRAPNG